MCQDDLLLHGAEELLGEGPEVGEGLVDEGPRLFRIFLGGIEFLDDFQVLPFQAADGVSRALGIVVVQVTGNLHERIRGTGHGGQHDEILSGGGNQLRDMLHTAGGSNGGAAKLHDFHLVKFVSFQPQS